MARGYFARRGSKTGSESSQGSLQLPPPGRFQRYDSMDAGDGAGPNGAVPGGIGGRERSGSGRLAFEPIGRRRTSSSWTAASAEWGESPAMHPSRSPSDGLDSFLEG